MPLIGFNTTAFVLPLNVLGPTREVGIPEQGKHDTKKPDEGSDNGPDVLVRPSG